MSNEFPENEGLIPEEEMDFTEEDEDDFD